MTNCPYCKTQMVKRPPNTYYNRFAFLCSKCGFRIEDVLIERLETELENISKMRTFVIGDIHGRFDALIEVFQKVNFNYKTDKLIILGDVVDGGPDSKMVVSELLKIENKVAIMGNHDYWFYQFFKEEKTPYIWTSQGGTATLDSYDNKRIPVKHRKYFENTVYFHIENNMVFVHGGWRYRHVDIDKETPFNLMWDRQLIERCKNGLQINEYDKVFVGHTTTQAYGLTTPIRYGKLRMLDTGAGWNGKLTIMNVDTEQYWQSEQQTPVER